MIDKNRLYDPLAKRAILPLLDRNLGFYEAVRSLKHLAAQLGAILQVLVIQDDIEWFRQHFDQVASKVTVGFIQVSRWQALRSQIQEFPSDPDLAVLVFDLHRHW